jgi:L-ascorbate metabolism protein UlaG (beta-lactamase superfamily)
MSTEEINKLGIEPYRQKHHNVYSYGYLIDNQGETEYFTGDTQEIPDEILIKFLNGEIDRLYVDTTFNPNCEYHMTFEQLLAAIPEHLRKNVYCMHLNENYDKSLIEQQFNIAKEREE